MKLADSCCLLISRPFSTGVSPPAWKALTDGDASEGEEPGTLRNPSTSPFSVKVTCDPLTM